MPVTGKMGEFSFFHCFFCSVVYFDCFFCADLRFYC